MTWRTRADVLDPDDWFSPTLGHASTLGTEGRAPRGWRPPPREFAPGFAGANPGPSHPEPAPLHQRRATPPTRPRRA